MTVEEIEAQIKAVILQLTVQKFLVTFVEWKQPWIYSNNEERYYFESDATQHVIN